MLKFKQIKGGSELLNDVEKLKNHLMIVETEEVVEHPSNEIKLQYEPILEQGIEVVVNGVSYTNTACFTFNTDTNSIQWILPNFNIDSEDFVVVKYYIRKKDAFNNSI